MVVTHESIWYCPDFDEDGRQSLNEFPALPATSVESADCVQQ